jgi:hypothetical protein
MSTTIQTIGSFGERLDIKVKQGSTLGPFNVTWTNPDTTAVVLTGGTVRGQIRRTGLATTDEVELTCTITNAAAGQFSFGLDFATTEAFLSGETVADDDSLYVYDLEFEDTLTRVTPLLHGVVRVFREVTR